MVRSILGIRALAALVLVAGLVVAPAALAQGLPEVAIEQPRDGADVATLGIPLTDIPLTVSYKSSAGVDKIEVLVDGAVQFVDRFSAPEAEGRRSYLWDATAHGPGKHTISVIVFAGARSAGAQAVVSSTRRFRRQERSSPGRLWRSSAQAPARSCLVSFPCESRPRGRGHTGCSSSWMGVRWATA